jgi:uncharacterized protein (TIGR02246 family)
MWDISQLRLNVRALTFNCAISNYNFPQYPSFVMKLLIVFALALLSTFAAAADPHSDPVPTTKCSVPTDDRAIRAIADEMKNAYNAGHPEKIAALYAPDAYYLTQHYSTGILHGRDEIHAYMKGGTDAGYKIDKIETYSTFCSGNLAYSIGRYYSTNADQKAFGGITVVLRKTKGKWLIVAHQTSVPEPTAIQKLPPLR